MSEISRSVVTARWADEDKVKVAISAFILASGKKRGAKFLTELTRIIALREASTSMVLPFIPTGERQERARVREETATWVHDSMPCWLQALEKAE